MVISSSPITVPPWEIGQPVTGEPPAFYSFAKQSPKEAAAIIAGYFHALMIYPNADNENRLLDVASYSYDSGDVLIQLAYRGGSPIAGLRVSGYENTSAIGKVSRAWIVTSITPIDNLTGTTCPSIDNAYRSGWAYSPSQVLAHLRSRTWRRVSDNAVVTVPADITIKGSAATTNVATYPTWRVEWQGYVIHYQAIPWWHAEPTPGFVFQSSPKIEPVT